MTQDDLFRPEGDEPPVKKASGCGIRFLVILLVSITGLSLLCCCGIGISMYSMVPKIEEDPAIAQQTLDELMEVELPEGFAPKLAVKMDVFRFINAGGVIIESPSHEGVLILARLRGSLIEQGNFIPRIEEAIKQEADDADIVVESREIREFEVDGQPVEFTFLKGRTKDADGAAPVDDEETAAQDEPAPEEPGDETPAGDDTPADPPAAEEVPANGEPTDTPAETAPGMPETPEATDTPTADEPPADEEPVDGQPADADAAEAPADAAADDAGIIRQVRALIPGKDGPILFLLIVPEKEWNEQEVIDMIESIKLK